MNFIELLTTAHHKQQSYVSAADVMEAAVNHALNDQQSTLHPVTRALLEDAIKRLNKARNCE
ncbi:hypothetical protein [Caudoviricetes sp.]|nr:hypothetical protein [Caudoviricetes sp.]